MAEVVASGPRQSSLTVLLHPLVIINVSEHFTRVRAQTGNQDCQVFGALLGKHEGRQVEFFNSFELLVDERPSDGGKEINVAYLETKTAQFQEVFADLDLVGWYTTGNMPTAKHLLLQKQITAATESPLFLLLNPIRQIPPARELPISVFESVIDLINDEQHMMFLETGYSLATEEAERIGVEHIARVSTSGLAEETSSAAIHLQSQHNAVRMLSESINVIVRYLTSVLKGELPRNHKILRSVSSLCSRLPVGHLPQVQSGLVEDVNDVVLLTYLATVTKGCNAVNEMMEKFGVVHDSTHRKRFGATSFKPADQ